MGAMRRDFTTAIPHGQAFMWRTWDVRSPPGRTSGGGFLLFGREIALPPGVLPDGKAMILTNLS